MKKHRTLWVAVAIVGLAITLASGAAVAQGDGTSVSGAGELAFPDGATFGGVSLSGLEAGAGVLIEPDGSATGQFFALLAGTSLLGPEEIEVDGKVSGGSSGPDGSVTFAGMATVDMGDGSVPLDLPFSVTATAEALLMTLGTSTLPAAALTEGSITIG